MNGSRSVPLVTILVALVAAIGLAPVLGPSILLALVWVGALVAIVWAVMALRRSSSSVHSG
jgi:high-affinity Fe2+/Pb2+ permease